MTRSAVAILSVLCLIALALSLGAWAARRTHNALDFAVGSRRLGVWLTALGYGANALSAWFLFTLCAAAFVWGAAAIWLCIGAVLGAALNLFYLAPRLRVSSAGQGAVCVVQVVSADVGDRLQPLIVRSLLLFMAPLLLLQAGAVLRIAGLAFAEIFSFDFALTQTLCAAVVGACVFAGGLRGAAAIELAQSVLMLLILPLLLLAGLTALGGWEQIGLAIGALDPAWTDYFGGKRGIIAVAFAGGGVGIGLAMCGQPQALNRFMAVRDEAALKRVRWVALGWIALTLILTLAGGWAANLLYGGLERPELALFAIAERLLPGWLGAILATALLAALISSIAGPLLALGVSLHADLKRNAAPLSASWMKGAAVAAALAALCLGVAAPESLLERAAFGYTALGAAIGPLLLVRLGGKRIRPGSMLGAMWSGFVLSLLFHLLPDSPGDFLERVLPFLAALGIALTGGERRRNPDRADRSQQTVHDRIPI
jgi:Na+/proline symporter